MQNQLNCEQVTALLSFYVEGKLSDKLTEYVKIHLDNCPECMEKFIQLKHMLTKFVNNQEPEDIESPYITKQYETFKSNLSAYIDNELNNLDSIKIKKIAISNPLARQDLENIYTFKKLLHSSFERTKTELKNDYSKSTVNNLLHENDDQKNIDAFFKLTAIFFIMITAIVAGIISILYF